MDIEDRKTRILTTHAGSLPRPDVLSALLFAKMTNRSYDPAALAAATRAAVADIVKRQVDLEIDIVSDGEQSKPSFQLYAAERLSGLEPIKARAGHRRTRENAAFPSFYKNGAHSGTQPQAFACTGPIAYTGNTILQADLNNLKIALGSVSPADVFVPSVSPSSCAGLMENRYYKNDEEHVFAVAEAMRSEYEAIVAAGFQVQIDDPRLAMHYMLNPDTTIGETRAWITRRIEALNHALRNIPPERVRHHTCYGINMGPRTSDFEMKHLADLIVKIRAGFYSFEMANPRHEHEWRIWEHVKLPDGKALVPGCITHTSVIVEHPELVAERIVRLARLVGRENVIAGTDCGFAQGPFYRRVHPSIMWAKLESLAQGARLASTELWK